MFLVMIIGKGYRLFDMGDNHIMRVPPNNIDYKLSCIVALKLIVFRVENRVIFVITKSSSG